MRFLGLDIVSRQTKPETRSVSLFDDKGWTILGGSSSSSLSVESATRNAAVYRCVKLIAESIASLPCLTYKRNGDARERATDHPLFRLLNLQPNSYNTRFEFIEGLVWHLLLRGNAYILKRYKGAVIEELTMLHPDRVTIKSNSTGRWWYVYTVGGVTKEYPREYIVHIRALCDDGLLGKGPLQVAREAVVTALAQQQYGTKMWENGVRLSGVLAHPGELDDEASKRIAASFRSAYAGASNAGKVAVIEEGMEFKSVSMTNQDAQFIEITKFSITEIARLFGIPPHMIGDLERATFSNIEEQSMNFVTYSIRPWAVKIEQTFSRDLLNEDEKDDYFFEFLIDALLRGNTLQRYMSYQIGLQNGFIKFNEIRDRENLNPLPWGDAAMIPLNMRPVRQPADLDAIPQEVTPNPDPN